MTGSAPMPPGSTVARLRLKLAAAVAIAFAAVTALVIGAGFAVWSRIPDDLRTALRPVLDDSAGLLLVFAAFLLVVIGFGVASAFDAYVVGMVRAAEGARIIVTVNPAHRLADDGPAEAAALARVVNELADRQQAALGAVEARIRDANARLDEEKQRLAALMSELTSSVLVCNVDGLILLYNEAARALLERPGNGNAAAGAGIVGLGRSVFGIIDREVIAHALDLVRERLHDGETRPVAPFVAVFGDRLIRAQMAPVRAAGDATRLAGFVLTLDDVTGSVQRGTERDRRLQSLTEDMRAGLAGIRAAVETLIEYEPREPARREQFIAIIRDESVRLSEQLDARLSGDAQGPLAAWPLEGMPADDLLRIVTRSVGKLRGVTATSDPLRERMWLDVDSFAVVQSFTALAARLSRELGVREFALALAPGSRFAELRLTWQSPPSALDVATGWEEAASGTGDAHGRLSLREVARHHGGEQWYRADPADGTLTFTLQLPVARPTQAAVAAMTRPMFYDFELFDRPGGSEALARRRLGELAYTVFDTETTGLEPSAGDEIVSLSAVRIVNSRLLRDECFDHLVNPRRPVSRESQRIHGITPAMLAGQPGIEEVLPRFARFAEDTVLVGHNVAFDMRFLQLKEQATGVRLVQPVLDTLLLSAVVHPELREHELEANAARLGIPIVGRHTSLGDAILTGEIFLKLLPLLAAQGVLTLGDALAASQQTYLSRVRY